MHSESTLFPSTCSCHLELRVGFDQESHTLGVWMRMVRRPSNKPVGEHTEWYHYSQNGVANILTDILDLVRLTEEYHGLETPSLEISRQSAPF